MSLINPVLAMRINKYILSEEISSGIYLYYNSFSNQFLILNQRKHEQLKEANYDIIEKEDFSFYQILMEGLFIVPDNFDELGITLQRKKEMQNDNSLYQIMVNTTLDCNLNCWYCYENRIIGSKLTDEVLEAVKKNIEREYYSKKYKILKVSFFGGEPFLNFYAIKKLLDYSKYFCNEYGIELIADFTTNAVLITSEHIDYLKQFRCHFQITIDGDRERHNKIKRNQQNLSIDTYQQVIDTLRKINENIPNRWLAVRINFDNRTLGKIDEIITDISFLDRKYSYVILKKIWQVATEMVDTELLYLAIQKFFDKNFLLDYYIMPKGCVCFAERRREALVNYDGKVFKCSTISKFDESNALGSLNIDTGEILWNKEKNEKWFKDIIPDYCKLCKWFPACLGPCNRQLLVHSEKICTFDSMNMGNKEYLMYAFKYRFLEQKLRGGNI